MKIVAFEGQGGTRLGIVEGDQVIDLNAADGNLPADLGESWRRTTATPGRLPISPSALPPARAGRSRI